MTTVIGLFTRKQGISVEEFRDYYENHHAPFATGNFGHLWTSFTRHYIDRAEGETGPDVISHIVFRDAEAVQEMYQVLAANPEMRERVIADEARFMDRDAAQLHVSNLDTRTDLG